jgi:hypothetical protein
VKIGSPVKLPVAYYKPSERKDMLADSAGMATYVPQLDVLVESGLAIEAEELLVYSMFSRAALKKEAIRSRSPITYEQAKTVVPDFERGIRYNFTIGPTLSRKVDAVDGGQLEDVGVGASLSLATRVFDCTEADFMPIEETVKEKTLDYTVDLDGLISDSTRLEMECKGTTTRASTYDAVSSIRAKKDAQSGKARKGVVRLGTVLEFDEKDGQATLLLVDPPAFEGGHPNGVARLLRRYSYYLMWLRMLSSHSDLLVALANRTRLLAVTPDAAAGWDGVPLVRGSGEEIRISENRRTTVRSADQSFIGHGRLFSLSDEPKQEAPEGRRQSLFVGIHHEVLELLAASDHQGVLRTKYPPRRSRILGQTLEGFATCTSGGVILGNVSES